MEIFLLQRPSLTMFEVVSVYDNVMALSSFTTLEVVAKNDSTIIRQRFLGSHVHSCSLYPFHLNKYSAKNDAENNSNDSDE